MFTGARRRLFVHASLLLLLAACGGGSGGKDEPADPIYSISGTVTGTVYQGILMTLGGDGEGETATDENGEYAFNYLTPGTYSVTPSGENLTFDPGNRICVIDPATGNVAGMDFSSSGEGPDLEDVTPPATTQRLVFVHHSSGDKWLTTMDGDLGNTLSQNKYYVRDVSLGWDATLNIDIGDYTDIGHYWTWFADLTGQTNGLAKRDNICQSLYGTDNQYSSYTNFESDPGGENQVILFMPGHLNSEVRDDNGLPPSTLQGQSANFNGHTLSNCKQMYKDFMPYFQAHQDKMFVIITMPPRASAQTLLTRAANARTLTLWLVNDLLAEFTWERKNVYVYDLFNVLSDADNHHWVVNGEIQHIHQNGDNFSYYAMSSSDSDPNTAGTQKLTAEFVPWLNACWHRWQAFLNP